MKNSKDYASRFIEHLEMLRQARAPEDPVTLDTVSTLVYSFLLWESDRARASTAFQRIQEQLVDYNELRVCLPSELSILLGRRYPLVAERSERLRSVLQDIYQREANVTLDSLAGMTNTDARAYLNELEGMVPFVSARVVLLAFEVPAVPADDQLRRALAESGLIDPKTSVKQLQRWMERQLKAAECRDAHLRLQQWVENRD